MIIDKNLSKPILEVQNSNEEVVQTQTYERNYSKFWEFLDSNELDYMQKPPADFDISNKAYWGVQKSVQEVHKDPVNIQKDPLNSSGQLYKQQMNSKVNELQSNKQSEHISGNSNK